MGKVKDFLNNVLRVLRVASKPTPNEYWASFKITGLGILAIGLIGFVIFAIFRLTGLFV